MSLGGVGGIHSPARRNGGVKVSFHIRALSVPLSLFVIGIALEYIGIGFPPGGSPENYFLLSSLACYAAAIAIGCLRSPLAALPLALFGAYVLPHAASGKWSVLGAVTMPSWFLAALHHFAAKRLAGRKSAINGVSGNDALVRIFSSCEIVDVDLSRFNERISLWALADRYEESTDRVPLVVVHFLDVQELKMERNPSVDPTDESASRFQWHICDMKVSGDTSLIEIRLRGEPDAPSLLIRCKGTLVERRSPELLDRLFPGWDRTGSSFVRPGIDGLAAEESKALQEPNKRSQEDAGPG